MIYLVEGDIGGGKSFYATQLILDKLASGGSVVSNVPLVESRCVQYCRQVHGVEIQPEKQLSYMSYSQMTQAQEVVLYGTPNNRALIVLDEVDIWFNARDFAKSDASSREFFVFLKQSRKVHVDVVLIVQKVENLDAQLRRLGQFTVRCINMATMRMCPGAPGFPFLFGVVVRNNFTQAVDSYRFTLKDRRVYGCYKSHATMCKLHDRPTVQLYKLKRYTGMQRFRDWLGGLWWWVRGTPMETGEFGSDSWEYSKKMSQDDDNVGVQ